jgi:hypothetical protein
MDSRADVRAYTSMNCELIRDTYVQSGWLLAPCAVLDIACSKLYGPDASEEVRGEFFRRAAPLARKIALKLAPAGSLFWGTQVRLAAIADWYAWTEWADRSGRSVMAADLHYFAGFSVRRAAALVELKPRQVISDFRQARSIVQIELPCPMSLPKSKGLLAKLRDMIVPVPLLSQVSVAADYKARPE